VRSDRKRGRAVRVRGSPADKEERGMVRANERRLGICVDTSLRSVAIVASSGRVIARLDELPSGFFDPTTVAAEDGGKRRTYRTSALALLISA
jgi:hypothetical protein